MAEKLILMWLVVTLGLLAAEGWIVLKDMMAREE